MDVKTKRTAKDYATDQEVRWCPGCGDYAILKGVQKTLAELAVDPDQTVFISGIGCAARFPYYLETYGFHTIHGRAAAIATGVKLAQPNLDVWIASGDGDSLSIGGNHFIHLLRRNVDCQYLLFNNEIYGLTKGQYSPTSRQGTRSPSSPQGSVETPIHAASIALGAGARFYARATDVGQAHLIETLKAAHGFHGTSVVEILQNCIVYNDAVHSAFTDKKQLASNCAFLEHGKPVIFGEDDEQGLRFNPNTFSLEVVTVDEVDSGTILVHDETNLTLAQLLAGMDGRALPLALGVIYRQPADTFEDRVEGRVQKRAPAVDDVQRLINAGNTWQVA